MFTKTFNAYTWISVILFSFVLYFLYLWIADYITFFAVFKTAYAVATSPLFYLVVGLLSGLGIVVDIFYRILEKEQEKPLYLLYRSLIDKDLASTQKVEGFENIIVHVENKKKEIDNKIKEK